MVVYKHNPQPNPFVRSMRRIYHAIGFQKGYNFVLFFIFAGALLGFSLARTHYMNVNNYFIKSAAAPGESYWYRMTYYNIGIHIHLLCVMPAGILAVLQFLPIIRHKLILLHRINGYTVTLLLLTGNVGALMIVRRAFGGTLATQSAVGTLALATTTSLLLAIYNIKRLQIDQHRAWMLRCWTYAGTVITTRLILILSALILSQIGSYYIAWPCAQIAGADGDLGMYPACQADSKGWAVVHADLANARGSEEAGAALQLSFGMAIWLSLALHAIGVELYLKLTPAEGERLRAVSYERQVERGFSHAGSAGLTVDRLGDCEEWKPPGKDLKRDSEQSLAGAVVVVDEQKLAVPLVRSDGGSSASTLGWR